MSAWLETKAALQARNFEIVAGRQNDTFSGELMVGSVPVGVEIEIHDYEFLKLPTVRITNRDQLPRSLAAHTLEDDQLCYADRATILLDRYQPAQSVLAVLNEANKTLSQLLHGNPEADVMAELAAYWSDAGYCLIDDPPQGTSVTFGECRFNDKRQLLLAGSESKRIETWAANAGGTFSPHFSAPVVRTQSPINPPSKGKASLEDVVNWLEPQLSTSTGLMDIVVGKADDHPSLLVIAPNAIIGFQAQPSGLLKASKSGGFRPGSASSLWKKEAHRAPIERFYCVPSSHKEVTARSLDKPASPLQDKKIALIGCGTIGGYLARALVQVGAGEEHALLLVDGDVFKPENMGRHILGARYLWRNKADAVAELLRQDFPDCKVTSSARSAAEIFSRLSGYDLVVDATGEEQFSNALNAHAISIQEGGNRFPPILFAMIFGNGLAAQTYLSRWQENGACYRCLKPVYNDDWRNNPIIASAELPRTAVRACSDGAYVPFSVAASHQAVGLATKHVTDFFEDSYTGDLRTVQIEPSLTRRIPTKNITRSDRCPACGSLRVRASQQPVTAE